jgi:hypothetical protein
MLNNKKILALWSGIFLASSASAGPFGLEMGMTEKETGGQLQKISTGTYQLSDPPNPHSEFPIYTVKIGPNEGLCWIKASGEEIEYKNDWYGNTLKSAVLDMRDRLTSVYGASHLIQWPSPNINTSFIDILSRKGRMIRSEWWLANQHQGPGEGLKKIELGLEMYRPQSFLPPRERITIEYYFDNYDSCAKEIHKRHDHSL